MSDKGKVLQTLGVFVCVGGLVWAGFALGRVTGKRDGRAEVEARWAHARSQVVVPTPAPPSALAAALAALAGGQCADSGPSPMEAPHFCRWGDAGLVRFAIHWWGPMEAPTRAHIAFSLGQTAPDNVVTAVEGMRTLAISFAERFGVPDGFWLQFGDTTTEASFLNGETTVTVAQTWIAGVPFMVTVNVTSGT